MRRSANSRSVKVKMRSRKRSPWRAMVRSMRRISTRSVPIPRITLSIPDWPGRIPIGSTVIHGGAHALHRCRQTAHDGFAHKKVADVEFHQFRQPCDCCGGQIIKPVAGMDFKTEPIGKLSGGADTVEFVRRQVAMPLGKRLAPCSGMDFDDRRLEGGSRFDLSLVRCDEQRHLDAGVTQLAHQWTERVALAGGVETTLGGALLTPLGYDADGMGSNPQGDVR